MICGEWRRVQAGIPMRSEGGSKEILGGGGATLWSESQRLEFIQTGAGGGRKSLNEVGGELSLFLEEQV